MPNTSGAPGTPAVTKLYEIFLAGEYAAVGRLMDDAAMAPTTADRVALLRMMGSEIDHFEVLAEKVTAAGASVDEAVVAHVDVFERYHRVTEPRNWLEVLVKIYIGDGMAGDFVAELVQSLPEPAREVLQEVTADSGVFEWARDQVRAAVAADPAVASPLALWGRRLLGEAVTHMQWVLAEDEDVTDLLFAGTGAITNAAHFFESMAQRHSERMAELSLT